MNQLQKQVDDFFAKQNWEYWSPLSMLAALTEEVGELARLVNHLDGSKPKKESEVAQEMETEVGDVLFAVICFANAHKIDIEQALKKSIKKVDERDGDRF